MASFRTACSINGLANTRSRLAVALLATWVVLINVSSAHASGQRCYMCGPESIDWFPAGGMVPCDQFTSLPEYEMDCGPAYDYCANIYDHTNKVESRACTRMNSGKCTGTAKGGANVFSICSCKGALCNNNTINIPQLEVALRGVQATTTTTEKTDSDESHEVEATTSKPDSVTEVKEREKSVTTPLPEPSEKENSSEEVKVNKTKEISNKTERDIPNMTDDHKDVIVPGHALPLPEALGQEHKKKPAQQGAPVDDEEDAAEGSGNRIEIDNKSLRLVPVAPTHIPYLPETTTTEATKNQGASTHPSVILSLGVWTLAARFILV